MGSEIIEIVERRRRWPVEEKLKILDDALQPGASVAAVADRHGVARALIYQWLRQVREGRISGLSLKPEAAATFVPVNVVPEARRLHKGPEPGGSSQVEDAPPPAPLGEPASSNVVPVRRRHSAIEIKLGNGRVMKVDESTEPAALARLLAVIDGGRL